MSYQFEILKQSSVRAVRSLGSKIVRTKRAFVAGQTRFAKLVAKTDAQEQTQKATMVGIMRPYVRKFAADKTAMHKFSKELKIAGLGNTLALKKVAKRTQAEKRDYNAFAKVQSDAAQELGIGAHSTSRGYTLPRSVAARVERAVARELNAEKDMDFTYSVRKRRGNLTVSVSRVG